MTAISLTGLQLFETPLAFQRRPSSAQSKSPLDALRALSQSLTQPSVGQQSNPSALPDFLSTAAAALASLRSDSTTATSGAFTVTRNSPIDPVHVSSLATAAHARSSGFSSLDDEVAAGTLALQINGAKYTLNIAQGETLKDVVAGVRGLGAPVDAAVETDGGQLHLGITTRATGFNPSGSASAALTVSETDTGNSGQLLGVAVDHQATNAVFTLHGVVREQSSNFVTDSITGAAIDLANPPASTASSTVGGSAESTQRSALLFRGVVGAPVGARISVDSLASAAQVGSSLYTSADAAVKAGTLSLTVEGKQTDVTINEGDTLADVRRNIQNSGAAVNATLVNDSGGVRLSITASATGYPLKGRPEDALTVTEKSTGQSGQALNPGVTQAATNASVTVDGTTTQSRTNSVGGAIPGFTLNAQQVSTNGAEIVTLPGIAGLRPPVNVENELNRVLQAQLLKPRDFGVTDTTAAKKDDAATANDPTKSAAARGQPDGGTESARRDILQKLTAVDDIFGALQAAHSLLQAVKTPTSSAASSTPASV